MIGQSMRNMSIDNVNIVTFVLPFLSKTPVKKNNRDNQNRLPKISRKMISKDALSSIGSRLSNILNNVMKYRI